MLNADDKTLERIAGQIQRVLIVDPQTAASKLLSDLLRDVCRCQIWVAPDAQRGLVIAQRIDPHIIFVEQCEGLDGAAFTRSLRRSDFRCRKAPVIMVTVAATASAILGARDSGVHEFLRKPYTIRDLMRRLEAVSLRPRDWVEGVGYVGPDRRRFNSGDYEGALKRRVDHAETPDAARIVQALKILKAAIAALESDPNQALRAMLAQCDELTTAAGAVKDIKLRTAAVALGQRLTGVRADSVRRADLEPLMAELWEYLPSDETVPRSVAA
ncbi:MAG: two-component system response regulator [Caulobacterales bacterium]